jgi:transcriptional regulator with XRE-family HTH domain
MLDKISYMKEPSPDDLNQRIAARVRSLRDAHGFSLDQLAERSGVSRSMISLIERGESSPTAVVLEKLATGLGVALASLFEPTGDDAAARSPLSRAAEQHIWQDPASGYVRRNVSPTHELGGGASPFQIVQVQFPAKARVVYEGVVQAASVHQHIWLLEGRMDITLGNEHFSLKAGDCLAHRLDRPIAYHNPGRQAARYAVVISRAGAP